MGDALGISWAGSTATSTAVYLLPTSVSGRHDFHMRIVIALAVTLGWAALVEWARPRSSGAAFVGALLGVATPPLVLILFLVTACSGSGCFD